MRRLLLLTLAAVFCAASASAADRALPKLDLRMPQEPVYEGLPGVKTPEAWEAQKADGFTCETVLRTGRNTDPRAGFSRTLPERVYRCEKNGLVLESPDPPARGAWRPGVNPPDARRR